MPNKSFVNIAMSDGERLAATLYTPDGDGPWPVILEALPYRKDEITYYSDPEYSRLCDEGDYVVCRIDVRGTGSSSGIATDEYPLQERQDLCEAIAWLAEQGWSTGNVGMYGTSYSGFNSLQIAAERPPALKAIISIFATDSRYTDDVHYGGGAMRGLDLIDYPTYMLDLLALPPVPSVYGEGWREAWAERLEKAEPWIITWLEHQNEDDYWLAGSVKTDYAAIDCPVWVIAGAADGYHNMAFRTLENVTPFCKIWFGPWSHMAMESSIPGPHLDSVPEMLKWWDRWLKGADNGVDREPPIQVFMRRFTHPEPDLWIANGEWRQEPVWPVERCVEVSRILGDGTDELPIRGDVGFYSSIWCAGTMPWGPPMDQRPDEIYSLVYNLAGPLEEDIEILGQPRVDITVTSSVPVAYLSAKLCDVAPDGTSALVARGILNLTHRDSMAEPTPLEPGRAYTVTFELDACAWIFEAGHTIRLDLAPSDWPNTWAPPLAGTLTIDRAGSRLTLPELHGDPVAPPPVFQPPPEPNAQPARSKVVWKLEHDVLARERRVVVDYGGGDYESGGFPMFDAFDGTITVSTEDPARSHAETHSNYTIRFPEVTAVADARMWLESDATTYRVKVELAVDEDGKRKFERTWEREIPRELQ
jgi:predicted acyl esterase